MDLLKIGLIREGKTPADARVALTPDQCVQLMKQYDNIDIMVQPSPVRSYKDEEYEAKGILLSESMSDRNILLGIKEVPIDQLIPNKNYFFFSHTIKKQPYNRGLLQAILKQNIQLVDYETLRNADGERIIGFGWFAGVVGAHNGIRAYGIKTKSFDLKAAHESLDFAEMKEAYKKVEWPPLKVVSTGNGKVAKGAKATLEAMGFKEVDAEQFVQETFDVPVFVALQYKDMYKHKESHSYDRKHFYQNPEEYYADFAPFSKTADVFVNGIYWDPRGPKYFTIEDMRKADFNIKVIADVTCDIAPESSIPATLRATKIGDDIMGFNPFTNAEVEPYSHFSIEIMSVDNLPNELPRDAADSFGIMLIDSVIPELLKDESSIIENATITKDGALTENYKYLQDYVDDNEILV